MSRTSIPSLLTAALRQRTEWDEAPCLYGMYRDRDGVALRPAMPEGGWPGGGPVEVLEALAAGAGCSLIITAPGFAGLAIRAEVWGRDGRDERWMWAAGTGGEYYLAVQARGDPEILAGEPEQQTGRVHVALERLVRSVMAAAS